MAETKHRTAVAKTGVDALAGEIEVLSPTQARVDGKAVQGRFKKRDNGALFALKGELLANDKLLVVKSARRLGRAGWKSKVRKTCNRYARKVYSRLGSARVAVSNADGKTTITCRHLGPQGPGDGYGRLTLTFDAGSKKLLRERSQHIPARKRARKPRLRF